VCGRFVRVSPYIVIAESFNLNGRESDCPASFNIAPGQEIAAVISGPAANPSGSSLEFFKWGLVPAWSKNVNRGMINARAETAAHKPSFQDAFRRRRCLIIADGFYEWLRGKTRRPFYITLQDGQPFGMAGIYETSLSEGIPHATCAILTVAANSLVAPCHERMPAIIPKDKEAIWLAPGTELEQLQEILRPFPAVQMKMHEVSTTVNSPRLDSPRCIEPLARQLNPIA
jgi:putative SOS response-associated peptidase YedK